MTYEQFKDALTIAGNTNDGHVTIGSLEEQLKIINEWIKEEFDPIIMEDEPL